MAVKMKPVGASEIKDPKIVREAIAQVRKVTVDADVEHDMGDCSIFIQKTALFPMAR